MATPHTASRVEGREGVLCSPVLLPYVREQENRGATHPLLVAYLASMSYQCSIYNGYNNIIDIYIIIFYNHIPSKYIFFETDRDDRDKRDNSEVCISGCLLPMILSAVIVRDLSIVSWVSLVSFVCSPVL